MQVTSVASTAVAAIRDRLATTSRREADARFEADMRAVDVEELREQLRLVQGLAQHEAQLKEGLHRQLLAEQGENQKLKAEVQLLKQELQSDGRLKQAQSEAAHASERARAEAARADALQRELTRVREEVAHERATRRAQERAATANAAAVTAAAATAPRYASAAAGLPDASGTPGSLMATRGGAAALSPTMLPGSPGHAWSARPPIHAYPDMMSVPNFGASAAHYAKQAQQGDTTATPSAPSADVLALQGALKQADRTNKLLMRAKKHGRGRGGGGDARHRADSDSGGSSEDSAVYELRRRLSAVEGQLGSSLSRPMSAFPAAPAGALERASLGSTTSAGHLTAAMRTVPRASSPTKRIQGVLKDVDTHIMKTRNLRSVKSPRASGAFSMQYSPPPPPQPLPPSPQPASPVHVNNYYYGQDRPSHTSQSVGPPSPALALPPSAMPGSHGHGNGPGGASADHGEQPFHNQPALGQRARVTTDEDFRGFNVAPIGRAMRPKTPGRRERFDGVRRVEIEDVTPPEKVSEDALRQARIEYFADRQRMREKKLQEQRALGY